MKDVESGWLCWSIPWPHLMHFKRHWLLYLNGMYLKIRCNLKFLSSHLSSRMECWIGFFPLLLLPQVDGMAVVRDLWQTTAETTSLSASLAINHAEFVHNRAQETHTHAEERTELEHWSWHTAHMFLGFIKTGGNCFETRLFMRLLQWQLRESP